MLGDELDQILQKPNIRAGSPYICVQAQVTGRLFTNQERTVSPCLTDVQMSACLILMSAFDMKY